MLKYGKKKMWFSTVICAVISVLSSLRSHNMMPAGHVWIFKVNFLESWKFEGTVWKRQMCTCLKLPAWITEWRRSIAKTYDSFFSLSCCSWYPSFVIICFGSQSSFQIRVPVQLHGGSENVWCYSEWLQEDIQALAQRTLLRNVPGKCQL